MGVVYEAWTQAADTLKPQKQGTCGLYSFWYATLLLAKLAGHAPIVYPRKGEAPLLPEGSFDPATGRNKEAVIGDQGGTTAMSMRRFAKQSELTAQGEVLNAAEMRAIIENYRYRCEVHQNVNGRDEFIRSSLKNARPVLIAYLTNNGIPIRVGENTWSKSMPHWSLIIDENDRDLFYLDPNLPNEPADDTKARMLNANAMVDAVKLTGGFDKVSVTIPQGATIEYREKSKAPWVPNASNPRYPISPRREQYLQNLLIAVYCAS